jgi:hypothetical protein
MSKTAIALVATIALAILFFAGSHAQPPAAVQPPASGRYQIASFDYRGDTTGSCGAYILDTQNGDVFQVVGKNPPEMLGSVEVARKKKAEH